MQEADKAREAASVEPGDYEEASTPTPSHTQLPLPDMARGGVAPPGAGDDGVEALAAASTTTTSAATAGLARGAGPKEWRCNLEPNNLLVRGTALRNTQHVFGMVVYTGRDCKIRMNVARHGADVVKYSSVFKNVNRYLIYMFTIQCIFCLFAGIFSANFLIVSEGRKWYLMLEGEGDSPVLEVVFRFFTWFIVLSQMVPISLPVSQEFVKTFQGWFIEQDLQIYDPVGDQPGVVRTIQINEELGQIEYIFSDKTGTLTTNTMEFRVAIIGGEMFGSDSTQISRAVDARKQLLKEGKIGPLPHKPWTEMTVEVAKAREDMAASGLDPRNQPLRTWDGKANMQAALSSSENLQRAAKVHRFLLSMAASNTITPLIIKQTPSAEAPIKNDGGATPIIQPKQPSAPLSQPGVTVSLQSSSPDELALCQLAQFMGYELVGRSPTIVRIDHAGPPLRHTHNVFSNGHAPAAEPDKKQPEKSGAGGPHTSETVELEQLAVLDFNSKRKRASIIYKFRNGPDKGKVWVSTKGADNVMLELLRQANESEEDQEVLKKTNAQLQDLAERGLRTLVIGEAYHNLSWWTQHWEAQYKKVSSLPEKKNEAGHSKGGCNAHCRICATFNEIETSAHLNLLGVTGIEDKLQDLVPEAIADFLTAGIKVWMLTGDKRETAKNIGLACNLIDPELPSVSGEFHGSDSTAEVSKSSLVMSPSLISGGGGESCHRLLEVTGRWRSDRKLVKRLFGLINQGRPVQISDLVRRIGMFLPPEQKDRFLDELRGRAENLDLDRDNQLTEEEFVRLIEGLTVSISEAIALDIQESLALVEELEEQGMEPTECISLLVEGDALFVLYPTNEEDMRYRMMQGDAKARAQMLALENLREDFFKITSKSKSVVACRLTPYQKAKIVSEQRRRNGAITLAIGDGANDEQMIVEANVGVGITGLEGSAASRAADFAIGQFRFLHTLLFVHGWWNYRRTTKLVHFIFYKAVLVAQCQYFFGIVSGFSGQQLFNDWAYLGFNLFFTSLPIMILATLDQGLSREVLEDTPINYRATLGATMHHPWVFGGWILRAILHGFVCLWLTVMALEGSADEDMWWMSMTIYTAVVFYVTLRITLEMITITWIHILGFFCSFLAYFVLMFLLANLPSFIPDLYRVFNHVVVSPFAWLCVLLTMTVPFVMDAALWNIKAATNPKYRHVLREKQRLLALKDSSSCSAVPYTDIVPDGEVKPRRPTVQKGALRRQRQRAEYAAKRTYKQKRQMERKLRRMDSQLYRKVVESKLGGEATGFGGATDLQLAAGSWLRWCSLIPQAKEHKISAVPQDRGSVGSVDVSRNTPATRSRVDLLKPRHSGPSTISLPNSPLNDTHHRTSTPGDSSYDLVANISVGNTPLSSPHAAGGVPENGGNGSPASQSPDKVLEMQALQKKVLSVDMMTTSPGEVAEAPALDEQPTPLYVPNYSNSDLH
eukprot:g46982.t1